jgi:hypothetical protein
MGENVFTLKDWIMDKLMSKNLIVVSWYKMVHTSMR